MGLVDYDKVAGTYQAGRGPIADIAMCRAAVQDHLPARTHGRLRVLDVGAGTGIFTRVWPEWGATEVVAVEPSGSMRAEAVQVGVPPEARVSAGRAEAIPVHDEVVDVAWLSAVFHHFTDPVRAVAELHRVVVPGGVVFLRALYSDHAPLPDWCSYFPGGIDAFNRFTKLADLIEVFEAGGFVYRTAEPTPQPSRPKDEVLAWVRRMRDADSFLCALTPEAVDAGIAALEATDETEIGGGMIHIAVFERPAA